jgi:hypothetical protein
LVPTVFGYHEVFHLLVILAAALQDAVVAFLGAVVAVRGLSSIGRPGIRLLKIPVLQSCVACSDDLTCGRSGPSRSREL